MGNSAGVHTRPIIGHSSDSRLHYRFQQLYSAIRIEPETLCKEERRNHVSTSKRKKKKKEPGFAGCSNMMGTFKEFLRYFRRGGPVDLCDQWMCDVSNSVSRKTSISNELLALIFVSIFPKWDCSLKRTNLMFSSFSLHTFRRSVLLNAHPRVN